MKDEAILSQFDTPFGICSIVRGRPLPPTTTSGMAYPLHISMPRKVTDEDMGNILFYAMQCAFAHVKDVTVNAAEG